MHRQRLNWLTLLGDVTIFYGALALTLFARYGEHKFIAQWGLHEIPFTIIFTLWILLFYISGLYELRNGPGAAGIFTHISKTLAVCGVLAIMLFYLFPYFLITPRINLFIVLAITAIALTAWRIGLFTFLRKRMKRRILLIGDSPEIEEIASHIQDHPALGYEIAFRCNTFDSSPLNIINSERITIIVASEEHQSNKEFVSMLYNILPLGIGYIDSATFYERIFGKIPLSLISEIWFLENLAETEKRFFESGKRTIDIIGSLLLGVLLLMLFPLLALVVKTGSRGPIFYKQTRLGRGKKQFTLLKFRTMYNNAEASGPQWATKNDPRVTAIGRFLRKTRLDELPQAWNVLKGDLSFVGPRPERPEFIEDLRKTIPFYDMRLLVRPGLSGWAQINPPYYYGTEREAYIKLQYDLFYIKNRNFGLDLSIALKTLAVLSSRLGR